MGWKNTLEAMAMESACGFLRLGSSEVWVTAIAWHHLRGSALGLDASAALLVWYDSPSSMVQDVSKALGGMWLNEDTEVIYSGQKFDIELPEASFRVSDCKGSSAPTWGVSWWPAKADGGTCVDFTASDNADMLTWAHSLTRLAACDDPEAGKVEDLAAVSEAREDSEDESDGEPQDDPVYSRSELETKLLELADRVEIISSQIDSEVQKTASECSRVLNFYKIAHDEVDIASVDSKMQLFLSSWIEFIDKVPAVATVEPNPALKGRT